MKRTLLLLLSLIITLSFVGCRAETSTSKFTYRDKNGGIVITGYSGTGDTVVIPNSIEGKNVIEIEETVFHGASVKSLTLPEHIETDKWGRLFTDCKYLETLKYEGEKEFYIIGNVPHVEEIISNNSKTVSIMRSANAKLESLKKITATDCTTLNYFYHSERRNSFLASLEEVWLDGDMKYYYYRESMMILTKEAQYTNFHPITRENEDMVYCSFFNKDEIEVNGTTYKSKKRLWD